MSKRRSAKGSFATPTCMCPACGYTVDRAGSIAEKPTKPQAGHWSICMRCGTVLAFNADLRLEYPDPAEWKRFVAEDPENLAQVRRIQAAVFALPPLSPSDKAGRA